MSVLKLSGIQKLLDVKTMIIQCIYTNFAFKKGVTYFKHLSRKFYVGFLKSKLILLHNTYI